ncbi:MAG: response regulator [Bacteroidota bacterium]|nr:response regulator [Bacteroidota bacterium]
MQTNQSNSDINSADVTKNFHRCLREVDGSIKNGNLTKARESLAEAKEWGPMNPYLKAFEERIQFLEDNPHLLKKSRVEGSQSVTTEKPAQTVEQINNILIPSEQTIRNEIENEFKEKYTQELHNAERNAAQTLKQFEKNRNAFLQLLEREFEAMYQTQITEERKRIQADAEAMIAAEKKNFQQKYDALVAENNRAIKEIREELHSKMEKTFLRRLEQISKEYDDKLEILGIKVPDTREGRIALYREKMHANYTNGQPSVEGAKILMRLKELLELTFDEHFSLESDVQLELYIAQVQKGILAGEITLKNKKKLDDIRKQFHITDEQKSQIESFIKSSFKKKKSKGSILVVDDDDILLQILEDTLRGNGFDVTTALDIESAFEKLKTSAFDLILCDIMFPQGDLDGFKFFSSVQEIPYLRKTPFIFMSALQDELVMRSGFQLGVDDYITKPFDLDILVAIINGKIKRYHSF